MLSWYYLGVAQNYAGDYNKSIVSFDHAEEISRRTGRNDFLGFIYMMKSYVYGNVYNLSEAKENTQNAVYCFDAIRDTFQLYRAKCTLGLRLRNIFQFEDCCKVLDEVLEFNPSDTFNMRKALLGKAVAAYYLDSLGAVESLKLFRRAIDEYKAPLDSYHAQYYAQALYKTGHKKEAFDIYEIIKSSDDSDDTVLFLDSFFAEEDKRYEEAFRDLRRIMEKQDSVTLSMMEQSIIKSQRDYREQEFILSQEKAGRRGWAIAFLCLLLVLTTFCATVIIVNIRKNRIKEKNELMMIADEAKKVLQQSENQKSELVGRLEEARIQYSEAYKKQFQMVAGLIEKYYYTSDKKNAREQIYSEVRNLALTVRNDRPSFRSLERNVNRNLENAMMLYRQEITGKDEDHYRLVCYYMAGYPASTIEMLTGLSQASIYTRKYRLLESLSEKDYPHADLFIWAIR